MSVKADICNLRVTRKRAPGSPGPSVVLGGNSCPARWAGGIRRVRAVRKNGSSPRVCEVRLCAVAKGGRWAIPAQGGAFITECNHNGVWIIRGLTTGEPPKYRGRPLSQALRINRLQLFVGCVQ